MKCLPLGKGIKRIWRKMFSSSKDNNYRPLISDFEKENWQPDHESCQDFASSFSSRLCEYRTPVKDDHTYAIPKPPRAKDFGEECAGSVSSGYDSSYSVSPPAAPFKVHEDDELSRSFDSLLLPLQSYRKFDLSSFLASPPTHEYSPFSSFNFADQSTLPSSFYSNFDVDSLPKPHESFSQHEEVRREFESNGVTKDIDDFFIPPAASTPMTARRLQYNTYNQQPQQYLRNRSRQMTQRKKFKPNKKSLEDHCVFCKNNGQNEMVYRTHTVKDAMGRTLCPALRQYKCPICFEDGDNSHTIKYCPKRPIITPEDLMKMGN